MSAPSLWSFFPFRLDPSTTSLWRHEQLVALPPKPFAVLAYLVTHAGEVVTKEALLDAAWSEVAVTEGVLKGCIRQIRQVLGETARAPQYIATVHRRGYRFIAPVTLVEAAPMPPAETSGRRPLPLIAREAELTRLRQQWMQVLQGTRQIVFITGEAGIGKTALVDAFVAQVADAEAMWIGRGQCIEQYGSGEAYLPILEVLSQWGHSPDGRYLVELLRRQAPSWLLHMPALLAVPEYEQLQRRSSGSAPDHMLQELAEAVETLTWERPLVLVLEDLHWSDYATLDWLALMARRRATARLLVLGTYRPADAVARAHPVRALTQELQRHGQCLELILPYLSAAGVAAYLVQRFGMAQFPKAFAPILHQRTNGNPFFLVTVVEELVRQRMIEQQGASWAVREDLDAVAIGVPESVRQLIDAQLMQVSAQEQEILAAASVIGSEFAAAAVAAGVEQATEDVEACCDVLARRQQFVRAHGITEWPDGTVTARYQFIHDLYREVLYDRIAVSRQVRWHRQIGARLEAGYGPRARDIAAELAEHFVRGRDAPRALSYLREAGETALQRHAYHEALTHLNRGLAWLQGLPDAPERTQHELALQLARGTALMATQGFGNPDVAHAYTRARTLCQQVGETPQLFPVLSGLWRYANGSAQHQMAWELGEQLFSVAQKSRDPGLLLQAHHALWTTAKNCGAFATAHQHVMQGLQLYIPEQHHAQTVLYGGHDPGVCCRSYMAMVLWFLGYPEQAAQWNEAALALAQELDHPFTLAHAFFLGAFLHQLRQDVHLARERAEATLSLGRTHSFPYHVAVGTILRGWALGAQGQVDTGLSQLQQGLTALRATGTEHMQPQYRVLLAAAYGQAGQVEAALATLAPALQMVEATGERVLAAELSRLQGELLHQRRVPDLQAAETWLHRGLTIARQQQAKSLELRAAMSLGRLWQQQGKRGEARQLLTEVYDWFTEGFDTTDLQEAKMLLDELAK